MTECKQCLIDSEKRGWKLYCKDCLERLGNEYREKEAAKKPSERIQQLSNESLERGEIIRILDEQHSHIEGLMAEVSHLMDKATVDTTATETGNQTTGLST